MLLFGMKLHHAAEPEAKRGSDVVAKDITKCADDENWTDQSCPAARNGHGGGCCRTADVGIAREDDFLKVEFEYSAERERYDHMDEDNDGSEQQNDWCIFYDQRDGRGHPDDDKEYIDQKSTNFLGPIDAFKVFRDK